MSSQSPKNSLTTRYRCRFRRMKAMETTNEKLDRTISEYNSKGKPLLQSLDLGFEDLRSIRENLDFVHKFLQMFKKSRQTESVSQEIKDIPQLGE